MNRDYIRKILYKNDKTKRLCLFRVKFKIWYQEILPYLLKRFKNRNLTFLIMTPEHGNIGDHAIAKAEIELLNKYNIPFVEITGKRIHLIEEYGLLSFMNKSTILVNGGGYLGTLWYNEEFVLRRVIQENPDSKIVLFPNTIFYEDSEWGQKELEKSKLIYNNHDNISMYAREYYSYELMKKIYKNVCIVPDIVLSLSNIRYNLKRKGCLLCLRNDREKTMSLQKEQFIVEIAHQMFDNNVNTTDMCTVYDVLPQNRNDEVDKKMRELASAELVITDRLHAMIFCAITGTPCIVVNSKSPKVKGCYEWIKDLDYIKFADEINTIERLYKEIPKENHEYNMKINQLYKPLIEELKTISLS